MNKLSARSRVDAKLAKQRAAFKDDSAETVHDKDASLKAAKPAAAPALAKPKLATPSAKSAHQRLVAQRAELEGMYKVGDTLVREQVAAGKDIAPIQHALDNLAKKLRFVQQGIDALDALLAGDSAPARAHAFHIAQEAMIASNDHPAAVKAAWGARLRCFGAHLCKE